MGYTVELFMLTKKKVELFIFVTEENKSSVPFYNLVLLYQSLTIIIYAHQSFQKDKN